MPVMSPWGPRGCTLCLLFLVAAACLWLPCDGSAYQGFLKRHQDDPKSNFGSNRDYCRQMMKQKGLKCQRSNVFIHTSAEQLKAICNSRGRHLQGTQTSRTLFPITICKLRKRWRKITCRYKGKSRIRKIRVTCRNGLPVHFISYV